MDDFALSASVSINFQIQVMSTRRTLTLIHSPIVLHTGHQQQTRVIGDGREEGKKKGKRERRGGGEEGKKEGKKEGRRGREGGGKKEGRRGGRGEGGGEAAPQGLLV